MNDQRIREISHQTARDVVREEMAWDRMRGMFERWNFAEYVTKRVDHLLPGRVEPLVASECTKIIPGLVSKAMTEVFPAWLQNSEQISQMIRAEVGRGRLAMHRAGEEVVAEMARKDAFNPIRTAVVEQCTELARDALAGEQERFREEIKDDLEELRRGREEFKQEVTRVKALETKAHVGLGLGVLGLTVGAAGLVRSCL